MSKNVLFILTSRGKLNAPESRTGTWLEELAASYWTLRGAGHAVSFTSPDGGEAPLDPMSFDAPWITDAGRRFLADTEAMHSVKNTAKLTDLDASRFDAVYLIGGAGTVYDFPNNPAIGALLGKLNSLNRPIAAVCHGVAGLLNESAGKVFAKGRKLTSISDAEDIMGGLDKILPMMPEQHLRQAGAHYSAVAPFEPHVVEDGNLVTGQNPASAEIVAKTLVKRLAAAT